MTDTNAPVTAPGDWLCECGKHNDPLRSSCYGCRYPREAVEIAPEPAPWRNMKLAPVDGPVVWIIGQLADGSEVRMHFAQDLSGSDQPAFSGWFKQVGDGAGSYFASVYPVRWRPE